ncbi:DNA-binding protein [Ensifer adhaerens]
MAETKLSDAEEEKLASDLLWGLASIAEFLGLELHQVHYKLAKKQIPAVQIGTQWVASKSRLTQFILERMSA